MIVNPEYEELGDKFYTPPIITSIMQQAETGEIPVLGAGYRGPFSEKGFDSMWTDMSEIVRPTRDGIHGREYISTVVDLGRKPLDVKDIKFNQHGFPIADIPPTVEIKLPILFDSLPFSLREGNNIQLSIAKAATELGTFTIIDQDKYSPVLKPYFNHIIECFYPENMSWREIVEFARTHNIVELVYSPETTSLIGSLKKINPDLIIFVRVSVFNQPDKITEELYYSGVDVIHLHIEHYQKVTDFKTDNSENLTFPEIIHQVHSHLVKLRIRDSVSVIASGEIRCAEHVPKAIILGADAVAIDIPLLIALECTVCKNCWLSKECPRELESIDSEWGTKRMVNLMASWHNQLLEILGAMGMREVARLRGETGRAMFKSDLDREIFGKIFPNLNQ
ncbi:MAG: glutamate synthase-related protein [Candidatus Aminicenantia bacterium]